jgi:hypothetical protein
MWWYFNSLDIHDPLNEGALNVSPTICSTVNLLPRFRGPWYGGDNSTMKNTISPSTATMTRSAISIPRQFLSFGVITTNSWNQNIQFNIIVPFQTTAVSFKTIFSRDSSYPLRLNVHDTSRRVHENIYLERVFIVFRGYGNKNGSLVTNNDGKWDFLYIYIKKIKLYIIQYRFTRIKTFSFIFLFSKNVMKKSVESLIPFPCYAAEYINIANLTTTRFNNHKFII